MRGFKFILLVLIGALAWFFVASEMGSNWLGARLGQELGSRLTVGRVVNSQGSFKRIRSGVAEEYKTALPEPLVVYDGDRLETGRESKLTLVLNSQDELELTELSALSLQIWNPRDSGSPIYLQLLLGALNAQKTGVRGKAYIIKNGRLYFPGQKPLDKPLALTVLRSAPLDLELTETNSDVVATDDFESDRGSTGNQTAGIEPDSLSNEYIDEVIVSRQSQLQKCWLSRLKDSPGLKGQIVLQFEISRRGKVRDLRVVDTTFDDDTLKRCVVTVFERLTFRPFKGQEITLSYPVAFE